MHFDPAITMQKLRNAEVFAETMQICKNGGYVSPSGYRITLPPTSAVLASSVFYETVPHVQNVPVDPESVVDVVNEDCIEAARGLVRHGFNPVMLNMASRRCPGGGVLNGARILWGQTVCS